MLYRYRAFAAGGQVVTGEVDAPARSVAYSKLRSQGMLVESLRPTAGLKLDLKMELTAPKLNLRQLSILFSQLAMLIEGGVPVLQSLEILAGSTRGPMQRVMRGMAKEVESGQSLSRALSGQRNVFPRVAIHVIGVSELAGELDKGLRLLSEQFDNEDQLQRKFKSAMIYPAVVLSMAFGLAIFMTTFIIPQYANMFADFGAELPRPTQILLSVSGFMKRFWYIVVGLPVGAIFGSIWGMRRSEAYRVLLHKVLLKIPVFGNLIRNRETARYSSTLGTMARSGVPILSGTQTAAELVENAQMAAQLGAVPDAIANGATLGRAVKDAGAFPPIMAELLLVGEIIGNTDTTLDHIAKFTEADVKQTVERLTAILEPVLILILGAIVLSVVVPLLLPMFDIYTKIK